MKRKLITVVCLVFSIAFAQSQIKFGPVVGLNFANVNMKDVDYTAKTGLRIGVMADFSINDKISISPELTYSRKGCKLIEDESSIADIEQRINLNYVELPINVVYHYKFSDKFGVFVNAGPYVAYAVSGKWRKLINGEEVNLDGYKYDIEFGSEEGELKPLDYGVNGGAGIEVGSLIFKAQYQLGLTNPSNIDGDDSKMKNTNLSFSLGFLF